MTVKEVDDQNGCLKSERQGASHGFLDSERGWIGDRLSLRLYAHGLSGGKAAQGH
jgi:hypothetical protein